MKIDLGKREIRIDGYTVGLTLFVSTLAIIYYVSIISAEGGPESVLFIKPILIIMLIAGAGIIARGFRVRLRTGAHAEQDAGTGTKLFTSRRVYFIALMVVYAAAIKPLGFLFPTFGFLVLTPLGLGVRNWKTLLVFSIGLTALYIFIFAYLFNVPMPIWPGQE